LIRYAEIALNIPFRNLETLTYEIPINMKQLEIGCRVEVSLNNRKEEGVVIGIHNNMPRYKSLEITRQIDKIPVVNSEQIELAYWLRDFYLSTLGEALYKMIPSGRRNKSASFAEVPVDSELLELNQEQRRAYENIKLDFGNSETHLLYGVTGSGKTEVYIHLIHDLLMNTDKGAILLVPEISLTIQILKRLELIFGKQMALIHSSLKTSEKFHNYMQLFKGTKRIAVGTRSAIFAPVKNLGLIILDEEHDGSYKEHSSPRYHARQVAMQRSKMNSFPVVLGSATPSVEAFYYAQKGYIRLNEIKSRAKAESLPTIKISVNKGDSIISSDLLFGIKQRLEKKEQVVILLNRRGYSPLVYNRKEKTFIECINCSSHLCLHKTGKVICHLCGYSEKLESIKKRFGEENIEFIGVGTQKLEEFLLEKFPGARIERLDQDATKNKGVIAEVITKLINREVDILTGTQMIAKGLDAAYVTLVGVINASIGLGLPDFRASERVFSLLTQVAGRAGRSNLQGEVIIESSSIEHPVIQMSRTQNYEKFFQEEIHTRKSLYFPPFSRLIRIVSRSKSETKSKEMIELLFGKLAEKSKELNDSGTFLLGPVDCPFYKVESNYRNHLLIKTNKQKEWKDIIKNILSELKITSGVYLEIDIDPIDLV
jgi:primosomal protein N' (replication factor Y)